MIEGEYSGPLVDGVREGKSALLEWSNGDRYEVFDTINDMILVMLL